MSGVDCAALIDVLFVAAIVTFVVAETRGQCNAGTL